MFVLPIRFIFGEGAGTCSDYYKASTAKGEKITWCIIFDPKRINRQYQGFVFCHTYPSDKTLYVIISDTGRSIFASYASDERYSSSLTNRESSGLLLALSGKSTKDRPENENRGYGISRSRGLIVNGLGGEFYILSGSAFVRYDSNGESIADLPQDYRWNGTLILLKIPTGITNDFDIYQYIS